MHRSLQDLLEVEGVQGLVLLSEDGRVIFSSPDEPSDRPTDWLSFLQTAGNSQEIDLIYDQGRLYIRKLDAGYLLVRMDAAVSIAMVKLSCDTVIPSLKQDKRSLFRRPR